VVIFLEIICVLLACWAAYLSFYRPPNFDWKESFVFSLDRSSLPEQEFSLYPPYSGMTWDNIDDVMLQQRLQYSLASLRMFVFGEHPKARAVAQYLKHELHVVKPNAEEIAGCVQGANERLLFFCAGEQVQDVLTLLHQHPGMRDVLYALILLDPVFDDEWMKAHFSHDELDAEANAPIPYIFLFSQSEVRIPDPAESKNGWRSIRCIRLGCLPEHEESAFGISMAVLLHSLYT